MQRGEDERGGPSEQEQKPAGAPPHAGRCCVGAAYFSESLFAAQRPPVCAGISKRLKPTDDTTQLPTDSVPGGDFKYVCLGYSAWDEQALKRAAAARHSQTDGVQLPYCEGLEVVSAAAVNQRPELMGAGAPTGSADDSSAAPEPAAPPAPPGGDVRQRPGRSFVPGAGRLPEMPGGEFDWDKFRERFLRISRRMVDKMGQNLNYMAATTRRSWEQILRELSGRDGDR